MRACRLFCKKRMARSRIFSSGCMSISPKMGVLLLWSLVPQVSQASAQNHDGWHVARSISSSGGRIVFPIHEQIDSMAVWKILEILDDEVTVPGLPLASQLHGSVTVALALDFDDDLLDAWSNPKQRLLVLPLHRALAWHESYIRRVIRHELAHIALGVFLDFNDMPLWFEEGFAEWAAGGLSHKGEVRLEIEICRRTIVGEPMPTLDQPPTSTLPDRLAYDVYSSFFEFLETHAGASLRDGKLMSSVKYGDVYTALQIVTGTDFRSLELLWQDYFSKRFLAGASTVCPLDVSGTRSRVPAARPRTTSCGGSTARGRRSPRSSSR